MKEKKALIIYAPEDVDKNRAFVDMCTEYLTERGIELKLLVLKDKNQQKLDEPAEEYLFAINRSRNSSISRQLENKGIRVFNGSYVTEIGNDKWKTYELALRAKIPVLKTQKAPLYDSDIEFPLILKSRAGHGGSEVFVVNNRSEYEEYITQIGEKSIVQPVDDTGGRDVRVYVIGGEIVVSICRQAKDGFKSNFSLGGEVEVYELSPEERAVADKVIRLLKPDYAGIDLIKDGNLVVLNEIEDAVGARMVYAATNINIIGMYMEYICQLLQL